MSVALALKGYWFREGSYLDLAVVRIAAVSVQLYVLVFRLMDRVPLVNSFADETFNKLPVLQILYPFGGRPEGDLVVAMYWIAVGSGTLAMIGLRTNVSLLVFAFSTVFVQAYLYSFGDLHHPEAVMMIALALLAVSPCNRRLSLDALMGAGHNRLVDPTPAESASSPYAAWPIVTIHCLFALMYLSAVISKFHVGGIQWANGFTLQYYLIQDGMRWGSPLALWLSQHHYLVLMAQIAVLLFQGTFWSTLIFRKLLVIYVPVGLMFHITIYLAMQAPFRQWIALYAIFIPWSRVFEMLRTMRSTGQTADA